MTIQPFEKNIIDPPKVDITRRTGMIARKNEEHTEGVRQTAGLGNSGSIHWTYIFSTASDRSLLKHCCKYMKIMEHHISCSLSHVTVCHPSVGSQEA